MNVAVSLLLSACSLIMVQPSYSHERWPAHAQRGAKQQQQSRWNRATVCRNCGPLITGPPPKHKVTPKGPEAPARICSEMFSHVRKLAARCGAIPEGHLVVFLRSCISTSCASSFIPLLPAACSLLEYLKESGENQQLGGIDQCFAAGCGLKWAVGQCVTLEGESRQVGDIGRRQRGAAVAAGPLAHRVIE